MVDPPRVVAVTGASGYIGARLLEVLEDEESLENIVAVDLRSPPGPFHNLISRRHDITEPVGDLFRELGVHTVVHLAFNKRTGRNDKEVENIRRTNLSGLRNVLRGCKLARVPHIVYLSSHAVYGAHRDNRMPITEDAPLRPATNFQYSMDKYLGEQVLEEFTRSETETKVTVLRTCVVMGATADNFVTKDFFKTGLVSVRGNNTPLQFVHQDDLARLLRTIIMKRHPGIYNVAGEGIVPYSKLVSLESRKLLSLPSFLAYPLIQWSWKLGIQNRSAGSALDFVRYPVVMSTARLKKEVDFRFRYTSEEALNTYLSVNL